MSRSVIIPRQYLPKLELVETQVAIKAAKDTFEARLASALGLTRVSARSPDDGTPSNRAVGAATCRPGKTVRGTRAHGMRPYGVIPLPTPPCAVPTTSGTPGLWARGWG